VAADLFDKILSDNLIAPYLELALRKDDWPEQLIIPLPEHGSKRDFKFHPSSHCTPDDRELYYRLHPDYRDQLEKRKFAGMDNLSMIQGTIFHVVIQQKLKQDGWLEDQHIEQSLSSEEHNGTGHLDFLFPNHPTAGKDIPVDIKTASPKSFDNMYKPSFNYLAQLNCYMDWGGWDEGVILVVEAGRPFRMKEFRVLRNELILHQVYSKWKRVREAIATNTPPPLCAVRDSFCTIGSPAYKSCPARTVCVINEEQGRHEG
jgi:hypothetical protein